MDGATLKRMGEPLARSAGGDQSAFAEIVAEYQAMVFDMALHFFQNSSIAEELSQEVFLRLYQNLATIKSPAHLMLWLRKVTSRRCIDEARRSPPQPAISLEEIAEPTLNPAPTDPLLSGKLQRLVASLPLDARMAVILRFQEELDLAEIAEVLSIPINTVKSRLQRSLAVLRDKLSASLEMSAYERPRE